MNFPDGKLTFTFKEIRDILIKNDVNQYALEHFDSSVYRYALEYKVATISKDGFPGHILFKVYVGDETMFICSEDGVITITVL